ncbi:MAG: MBL fold metallo-hydrolase [Archaeoglobus sp.]|nr:MBL fold metallo-hydrolase [Archaeoglobus sp.]
MPYEKKEKVYCFDSEIFGEVKSISFYIIKAEKPAVVEPGPNAAVEKILHALEELKIGKDEVAYIFVTHIHLDHGGGAGLLAKFLPDARVVCHPKAVKHLVNPEKLWIASLNALGKVAEGYGKPDPLPEERIVAVKDGIEIDLGDDLMECLLTPGHAPHHASYFLKNDRILFTGDSAGVYAFGRIIPTTPPPFKLEDAIISLEKMMRLKPKVLAFTHFGFAENGDLLEALKVKLQKWGEIALGVAKDEGNIQTLHSKLLEKDGDYKELYELTKDSVIISGFHQLTLLGLLEYAKSKV